MCDINFNRQDNYVHHMKRHNIIQTGSGRTVDIDNQNKQTDHCNFNALHGTVETITLEAKELNKFDPMTFLKSKYDDIKKVIKNAIKEKGGMKWYMSLKIKMSRRKGDDMETAEPHFRGKCQTALKMEDIEDGMKDSIEKDVQLLH